ncbi:ATP-dependent DNA helicase DinG [Pseudoalteromonas tunicata]|jgi:ATP-dependent DNA helicase DinG|uniref:ATP-dependent DNA helicase DinG n=1 Tax=Pseudoalteromonas tunicata D2 TaxID=87626 RepID=A4C5S0_9GAMM|nr:ATP-dependent DNA helicase DinG [Pseudoalteromonas tunicata]ATC95299.1 ATP-dependent DNA helicase DinG [Pseudoalteromonas tunicata]AXT30899.1 ATP-dependent DNA helicase DinG [Pseudoalteromonas tunicata]EAR29324.1 putative ATP-dependent helicase DinG [Pseudoalteromonas tunicata D2]MDP4984168.1 ATP-dependent DNA helicase DinG [Pseudoalteromonas tunicata]MDP5213109.1 ATP-dependent DNA helicase DinG [Pseudoalteromonas tunicata]
MLSDALKKSIRKIHQHVADNLSDYKPRKGQNYLVAEIAKTLSGQYHRTQRICVMEAGTGTGKSLAYCLGALPYALSKNQKLVISTATVALQEQLIEKELPFFAKHSGLEFKFDLVKGRNRYICAQKLAMALEDAPSQLEFIPLSTTPLSDMEKKCLQQLQQAYQKNQWAGDRDSWADTIPDAVWHVIVSDKHACQRQLNGHQHCPFHQARNRLNQMDVLVVNHSLLLADLDLGGGTILPEPANCIYVIDEAHHLPQITRDFSSASGTVKGTMELLEKLSKFNQKLANAISSQRAIGLNFKLADALNDSQALLKKVRDFLNEQTFEYNDDNVYRFSDGELPQTLQLLSKDLNETSSLVMKHLRKMHEALTQDLSDGDVQSHVAEPILAESGVYLQRVENFNKLWHNLTHSSQSTPHARWLKQLEYKNSNDHLLADCPIEVGFYLKDKLWHECAGAVLCSATLTALGTFDHFAFEAGLVAEEGVKYLKVPSPFDYPAQATLHLPKVSCEPTDKAFTQMLIDCLPDFIEPAQGNLILFSSYWQMGEVAKGLRAKGLSLLIQGEASREALLNLHKTKIDGGNGSILMGTQGLSEGLDLPGNYLTNLIITKLPFAVPTSPVEEAQAEYVQKRGGNAFLSITVPDASKKLVQSCGRLLRKEQDSGRIVILDRRLISKRYGKAMLDSLPPFKRQIDY